MKLRAVRVVTAVLVTAAAVAACSSVVNGTGTTHLSSGHASPTRPTGFPSSTTRLPTEPVSSSATTSSSPIPTPSSSMEPLPTGSSAPNAAPDFSCPSIVDPGAHLEFDCITSPMKFTTKADVWPHQFYRIVEPSTGWNISMGAGHWGSTDGHSLETITEQIRLAMVDKNYYGSTPRVRTLGAINAKINGVQGFVLESVARLSPAFRAKENTAVRTERFWIVAIDVGPDDVSLWYVSIPDIESSYWSKVHDTIASIHVI